MWKLLVGAGGEGWVEGIGWVWGDVQNASEENMGRPVGEMDTGSCACGTSWWVLLLAGEGVAADGGGGGRGGTGRGKQWVERARWAIGCVGGRGRAVGGSALRRCLGGIYWWMQGAGMEGLGVGVAST